LWVTSHRTSATTSPSLLAHQVSKEKMKLFVATLAAAFVAAAVAECPNGCSGHGSCGIYSDCTCYRNWMGADCSERVCYFGHAFVDTPQGDLNADGLVDDNTYTTQFANTKTWEKYDKASQGVATPKDANGALVSGYSSGAHWDEAHFYRECSNKGVCNRQSGICTCYPGYEGEGCTRTVCPNDCSGHGTCQRLKDWNDQYEAWDAYKTQHCVCDPGYMGPDCSLRVCPSGDDPVSRIDTTEVQRFLFSPGGAVSGNTQTASDKNSIVNFYGLFAFRFTDEFGDSWTTTSLSWPSPPFNDASQAADLCNGTVTLPGHTHPTQLKYANPTVKYTPGDLANAVGPKYAACSVATSNEVANALKALPNDVIPDISVSFGSATATPKFGAEAADTTLVKWEYDITFTGNTGDVNQLEVLYEVTECQGTGMVAGSCNVNGNGDRANSPQPTATAYSSSTNPFPSSVVKQSLMSTVTQGNAAGRNENAICSNRGVCDYSTGLCKCFKGYTAHDCSQQNSLAAY